jgi:hypothetical protein
MNALIDSLAPLKSRISEKSGYLGVVIGLAAFSFSLFLPWASIPAGISATDGGSSSGWSELAFFAVVPLSGLLLSIFGMRKPIRPKTTLISVLVAFAVLGFNNIVNRSTWQRPFSVIPGTDSYITHANFGSSLDIGFCLGLIALTAVCVFGLAWSLHKAASAAPQSEQRAASLT